MTPFSHSCRPMPVGGAVEGLTAAGIAFVDRPGLTPGRDDLPIVFVHGSGFAKAVFAPQFTDAEFAGRRLIAIDLPGHGASRDSDDPKAAYSYAGLADSLLATLKDLRVDRCVVAGWSLGGHAALELVDRATCVKGVMAFGAAPAPAGPLGLLQSMHMSRTLLLAAKPQFTMEDALAFERACLGTGGEPNFTETLMRTDRSLRPTLTRSLLLNTGLGQDERLRRAIVPVCLVHGARDPLVRTNYVKGLSAPMLHTGRAIIMPASGHAPFVDDPFAFASILNDFTDCVAGDRVRASIESRTAAA